jgi:hypothetical protein
MRYYIKDQKNHWGSVMGFWARWLNYHHLACQVYTSNCKILVDTMSATLIYYGCKIGHVTWFFSCITNKNCTFILISKHPVSQYLNYPFMVAQWFSCGTVKAYFLHFQVWFPHFELDIINVQIWNRSHWPSCRAEQCCASDHATEPTNIQIKEIIVC